VIILTTMVRNESKALPRLLRSCKGIVDAVALTDTGSTDDTLSVASEVCRELGIGLFVEVDTWSDFGTNRTRNLQHGAHVAYNIGDPLASHHLLLLDADMEVPAGTGKPAALPDIGVLAQSDGRSTWWNVRVLRADVAMNQRFIGRTHEYVTSPTTPVRSRWFVINDHCDGGCRSDKFQRDEILLRKDLEDNPNNPRAMFYLAQTLHNLGRKEEAIEWYDKRAKFLDFPEEAWVAKNEAARCTTGAEADVRALEAYFIRPCRAEPLADLATRAANAGKHALALGLASIGKTIPYPADETLYCPEAPYRWAFPYVEMISSYYVGDLKRGQAACEYLHLTPGSPHAQSALDNLPFYAPVLPGIREPLAVTLPDGFNPASPCFYKTSLGWLKLIRGVNYKITTEGGFWIPGEKVVTRNFVIREDGSQVELLSPPAPNPAAQITGFEDQRIVDVSGDILMTAGVRCDASSIGMPELWWSQWNLKTGAYVAGAKMSVGSRIEKNWLPFRDGYLYAHGVDTTFVNSRGSVTRSVPCPHIVTGFFRGSAAPIPYRGGYLYMVHEVATRGRRVYLHRFCFAPEGDWSRLQVSPAFKLKGESCMESCFSINVVPGGVLLSCAYEDKEVYTITVSDDTLKELLP
jgi:tetratricopeptide (TPR) repeat protein